MLRIADEEDFLTLFRITFFRPTPGQPL
jgi:hypothetical protein